MQGLLPEAQAEGQVLSVDIKPLRGEGPVKFLTDISQDNILWNDVEIKL